MRVVIVGEKYSKNLGDGVIFDVVEEICKSSDFVTDIIQFDISGKKDYDLDNSKSFFKKVLLRFSYFKKRERNNIENTRHESVMRNLKSLDDEEIDCIVFAGGQMFMDYFVVPIKYIVEYFQKREIPIIFNSCGVGSLSVDNEKNLRDIINSQNVVAISVRDHFDQFKNEFIANEKIRVEECLDPVVELNDYVELKPISDKNNVGIGIMHPALFITSEFPFSEDNYKALINKVIELLNNDNVKWEFFTNGSDDDENYLKQLSQELGFENKISTVAKNPKELVSKINGYEKVISFRLHSQIIAQALHIPVIGFIWNDKVRYYGEITNTSEWFLELNNKTVKAVEPLVNKLLETQKISVNSLIMKSSVFLNKEFARLEKNK